MAKVGSPSMRVRVSTASGADAAHDISDYIRSLSGIQVEPLLQEGTAFGESWTKHHFVGVRQGAVITMAGYYDDVAGSPHSYFGQPGDIGAERMLEFSFTSTLDTFRTPAKLTRYSRVPSLGGLMEWEAEWSPTGTPSSDPGEALIDSVRVTANATAVVFGSIPTHYSHLHIVGRGRHTGALDTDVHVYANFNGDSATNYAWEETRGAGTSTVGIGLDGDVGVIVGSCGASAGPAGAFGLTDCHIFDYGSTAAEKGTDGDFEVRITGFQAILHMGGWWKSTAPITSIKLYPQGSYDWTSGTEYSLYGIP